VPVLGDALVDQLAGLRAGTPVALLRLDLGEAGVDTLLV